MSHLTNYENRSLINTNKEMLGRAVAEMGVTLDYVNTEIKNTWITEQVDAAIIYNGKRIAAGLNFVTSGDFYGTGLDQEEFTNLIAQTYQKHNVISKCEEQGWYVEDENVTVDANGKIVINAYRFA